MLLPSALPCDSSSQSAPLTRLQSALFSSPPASPPHHTTHTAIGNLFSTCRSLQSLLANPAVPPPADQDPTTPPMLSPAQLPSPPLAHAEPPLKLRLRSRKTDNAAVATTGEHGPARMRIVKRTSAVAQQAPRGPNKRRRGVDDDNNNNNNNNSNNGTARSVQGDSELEREVDEGSRQEDHDGGDSAPQPDPVTLPHTPKRSRIAPEIIPLGLERADYHSLHSSFSSSDNNDNDTVDSHNNHNGHPPQDYYPGTDVVVEADGEPWSTEDDRILVELVLEKLKLTKSDWQDCARSLGKDRGSVGRRWKSLMSNGDVGLKRAPLRRPRIHGTWR